MSKTVDGGPEVDRRPADLAGLELDSPVSGSEKAMRISHRRRNRIKVLVVMFFAVVFLAFGNIALSKGMKIIGMTDYLNPYYAFLAAIGNSYIIGGTLLLVAFLLLYLASLSWEDLSFVLPLTAAETILVALLACFLLHEHVSALRWAGSVFVAAGIALVSRS